MDTDHILCSACIEPWTKPWIEPCIEPCIEACIEPFMKPCVKPCIDPCIKSWSGLILWHMPASKWGAGVNK